MLQAARNRSGPISPCSKSLTKMPRQQTGQVGLAHGQRQLPQIVTIKRENIEGVQLHFVVMPAGMQPIEIGDAIDSEQDRLAVDHERGLPVPQRGFDDKRITRGPVVAVAGEQRTRAPSRTTINL